MNASATTLEITDETVDQLIARVLNRAHQAMEDLDAPTGARAILQVAYSFADELALLDPDFDRLRFIEDVTQTG